MNDLASIVDEQEAEIGRLRAELAVVRRDWQADVGTLTANLNTAEARVVRAKLEYLEALERAQTAEARAARLNTEIAYLIEDNEEMGRREMLRAAAARKVAQFARSEINAYRLDVEDAHQRRYQIQAELDAARAEVMALLAHMIAHNVELQDTCEKQKRSGECSNVGMCDSCPRQWMIDALRESNDGNE